MRRMSWALAGTAILVIACLCMSFLASGCAAHTANAVANVPATQPYLSAPGSLPTGYEPLVKWLLSFDVLAVLSITAAVVVFFLLPEAHNISLALGVGGASLLGTSLFTQASLWLINYVVFYGGIVLCVAAGVFFIYEIVTHKGQLSTVIGDVETEVESAFTTLKNGATQVVSKVKSVATTAEAKVAAGIPKSST